MSKLSETILFVEYIMEELKNDCCKNQILHFNVTVEIAQSIMPTEQKLLDFKMKESVTAAKLTLYMVTSPKHPIVCYRCGSSELAS